MAVTKLRLDTSAVAKNFNFENGGIVNFGSTGTSFVSTMYGSMEIKGNFVVQGTETVNNVETVNSSSTVTGSLTVNGSNILGNEATDTTDVYGALSVRMAGGVKIYDNSATPVLKLELNGATGAITTAGASDLNGNVNIGGNLTLDATSSVLVVGADDANNNTATIHGNVTVGSTSNNRNLTVNGNLIVTGTQTFTGGTTFAGAVTLGDADTDVTTIEGTIVSGHSSGSLEINDAAHITGAVDIDGALNVDGNATMAGITMDGNMLIETAKNLTIKDNAATPNTVFEVLGASGNTSIAGTLTVTLAVDFNYSLAVAGDITLDKATAQTITSAQALTITTNAGTITLNPYTTLEITKATNITGTLAVTGNVTVSGTSTIGADDATNHTLIVYGDVTIGGTNTRNLKLSGTFYNLAGTGAPDIYYSNTTSGMTATRVQTAIDELDNRVDGISGGSSWLLNQKSDTTANGTVTNFVTPANDVYTSGKVAVYKNGQRMVPTDDYTEAANHYSVDFVVAPSGVDGSIPADKIYFDYIPA